MSIVSFNLVIVGVGGQGTLLASKIVGAAAMSQGCEVKVSEVHGMAQRGGSVITHVRAGEKVYAPLVTQGEADFVMAFEELEALRAASFCKQDGVMVVNRQQIMPMPVIIGTMTYPEDPLHTLEDRVRLVSMDALALAKERHNPRGVNMVLLGALSNAFPWEVEVWENALRISVRSHTLEKNWECFLAGKNLSINMLQGIKA